MQTENVWIDSKGKKVNFDVIRKSPDKYGVKYPDGLSPLQLTELGYQELTVSTRPDDFNDETYYRTEQDDAPYIAYTPKSDEQLKAVAKRKIDRDRDAALSAHFKYGGFEWHTDAVFQSQMTAYTAAYASGVLADDGKVDVRDTGNVTHAMTKAEFLTFAAALMGYVAGIYKASWAAKDEL